MDCVRLRWLRQPTHLSGKTTLVAYTHLFKAFGIPVRAHWSFWLFMFWIAWDLQMPERYFSGAFFTSLFFMVCLMSCLLLHELGHCLTARRCGINTREIKMTCIGGMAMFERSPREPRQELFITAAGPLVNFVIAGLVFGLLFLLPGAVSQENSFLLALMWANLALGIFNLLPGFPMDGGRILRALLALKLSYLKATHIAVRVGQVVALGFIYWSFQSGSIFLFLIALMVIVLAQAELLRVRTEEALKRGSADLNRFFGGLFRGGAPGNGNARSWGFTFGGAPPTGAPGEETSSVPPPPRDDSDCVIDMDSDGKVRKIWRKDEERD